MSKQRDALELARDALNSCTDWPGAYEKGTIALAAIDAALAAPDPQPVARPLNAPERHAMHKALIASSEPVAPAREISDEVARLSELHAEAQHQIDQLRGALQTLIDQSDDSDGSHYGTLSTSFVREIARDALAASKEQAK